MTPRRTCIGCRRIRTTDELVRVVRTGGGTLALGRELPGRGAWLCRASPACVEEAAKRRAFGRALRGPVDEREVQRLSGALPSGPAKGGPPSEDAVL